VTVSVARSESNRHDLIRALFEHTLKDSFDTWSVVGVHDLKDTRSRGGVVVVAEEALSAGAFLADDEVAINDDDEVRRRGENGLGHFDVRRQFGRVRIAGSDVTPGGVDQFTAALRRPFNPAVAPITAPESILESGTSRGWFAPFDGALGSGRFHVIGVDEVDEVSSFEVFRRPSEDGLPRGIRKTEFPTGLEYRKEIDGVPKVFTQVRAERRFT
jgi:hypothetical protein